MEDQFVVTFLSSQNVTESVSRGIRTRIFGVQALQGLETTEIGLQHNQNYFPLGV